MMRPCDRCFCCWGLGKPGQAGATNSLGRAQGTASLQIERRQKHVVLIKKNGKSEKFNVFMWV